MCCCYIEARTAACTDRPLLWFGDSCCVWRKHGSLEHPERTASSHSLLRSPKAGSLKLALARLLRKQWAHCANEWAQSDDMQLSRAVSLLTACLPICLLLLSRSLCLCRLRELFRGRTFLVAAYVCACVSLLFAVSQLANVLASVCRANKQFVAYRMLGERTRTIMGSLGEFHARPVLCEQQSLFRTVCLA